jgi:AcrR family transcriptional regulator
VSGSPSPIDSLLKPSECSASYSDREREILRKAIDCFSRTGFANTDVQEIANLVGVGKGTVYRCFANKECLFLAAARYARDCVIEAVDSATSGEPDPLIYLQKGMRAFLRYFDEHPEAVEMLIEERTLTRGKRVATFFDKTGTRSECWHHNFQQLIDAGILRPLSPQEIENAISQFLWGALFVNYFAGAPTTLESQFEKLYDIIIHGIGAQPAANVVASV